MNQEKNLQKPPTKARKSPHSTSLPRPQPQKSTFYPLDSFSPHSSLKGKKTEKTISAKPPSPSDSETLSHSGYLHSFDDTRLYYEVKGQGPALFFVYGIGCAFSHWRHQVYFFAEKGYRVVLMDLRGHHRSEKGPLEHCDSNSVCKDIEGLMDHLGIDSCPFFGHSFGVKLILDFAHNCPERVSQLVCLGGFAKNPFEHFPFGEKVEKVCELLESLHVLFPSLIPFLIRYAFNNTFSILISGLIGGFNLSKTSWKDLENYFSAFETVDPLCFLNFMRCLIRTDCTEKIKHIKAPCLIFSGEADMVTDKRYQRALHELCFQSELISLPTGSHCVHLEEPHLFNYETLRFLENSSS